MVLMEVGNALGGRVQAPCALKRGRGAADLEWVRNPTIFVDDEGLRRQTAIAPRLAGLLLVCMALFALATLVGLFANAYA